MPEEESNENLENVENPTTPEEEVPANMCSTWGKGVTRAFPEDITAGMMAEGKISPSCIVKLPEERSEILKKELEERGLAYPS